MAFVIAVAQRKGGAGKSTLAANLAAEAAGGGARVALLDIDPQQTLARWHALRAKAGRAAAIDFDAPSGWRIPGMLDRFRRSHDLVVLDTPPHAETDAKVAIRAADLVLVPLQPSPADLWAMDATLELAAAERRACALVLNRVPSSGRLPQEVAAELRRRGLPLLDPVLGNRTGFVSAFAAGLGVTEHAPRSAAAEEVRALAAALRERRGA
ncbi:MAG TPA: ParA family partition ATPase [Acetobacteraceae bacterium]|nr:ParA family partition ATPase [Acetobacteraceae bacterium]